tara:strand:- start:552 stop:1775 length:1224 start_codon:yes stop_codon:yes gene_type:complete
MAEDFLSRIPDYIEYKDLPYEKLWLDPNNPRFRSQRGEIIEGNFFTEKVITSTKNLMNNPKLNFDIPGMMNDFIVKGFIDGDDIIVRKSRESEKYIVCEGNRRLAAIQKLFEDVDKFKKIRPTFEEEFSVLPVVEVVQKDLTEKQMFAVIDQLLGIRQLNQLKQWSPFARGSLLYQDYLTSEPKMTKATFVWDENKGKKIAENFLDGVDPDLKKLLPRRKRQFDTDDVKLVLQTIRIMEQLDDIDDVFMKGRYYSLFEELCKQKNKHINVYIPINPKSFKLEPQAINRVITLCQLNDEKRTHAAIDGPRQWRSLSKLLDPNESIDEKELKENIRRVEEDGHKPDQVVFEREAKRQSFTWATWLRELKTVVQPVQMQDVPRSDPTVQKIMGDMWNIIKKLRNIGGGNR